MLGNDPHPVFGGDGHDSGDTVDNLVYFVKVLWDGVAVLVRVGERRDVSVSASTRVKDGDLTFFRHLLSEYRRDLVWRIPYYLLVWYGCESREEGKHDH